MLRGLVILTGFVSAAGSLAQAQQGSPSGEEQSSTVIRAETRLVLVDTVVTDKKGAYIRDLTMKNFRVWEDNKEQEIKTFSFEADAASPAKNQQHYLVLFFDNSSMQPNEQIYARQAAAKFIDANAGPNRLMAVADFNGSLRVAQNFTADAERLKQVVNGIKFSSVSPNAEVASLGAPSLGGAAADFGARDVLLALRTLAKSLGTVPGRKTLVFLSAGFALDLELRSELTAVIDVCNKANVAVYPIDVRGLVAAMAPRDPLHLFGDGDGQRARLVLTAFNPQHGGGASGGGGGGHGGGGTVGSGSGGGRGGTSGSAGSGGRTGGSTNGGTMGQTLGINNPYSQARSIVPQLPPSPVTNQWSCTNWRAALAGL